VSERDDITAWKDRADPTEKRDWDLPFTQPEEPAPAHGEKPTGAGLRGQSGPGGGDAPEAPLRATLGEPAEESEKRDWDIP
jgi:hypothetical protein